MSGNLLLIGKSGAMAARAALDLTAQNIANASNPDYARRTLSMAEVAAKGGIAMEPGASLSGVRPDQVLRTNSFFLTPALRDAVERGAGVQRHLQPERRAVPRGRAGVAEEGVHLIAGVGERGEQGLGEAQIGERCVVDQRVRVDCSHVLTGKLIGQANREG